MFQSVLSGRVLRVNFIVVMLVVCWTTGLGAAGVTGTPAKTHAWNDSGWINEVRGLADGESVRLEGIEIEGQGMQTVSLERFRAFAADAKIVVHGNGGEVELSAPGNVYLKGRLDGRDGSRVTLTVRASGEVRGLIAEGGSFWMVDTLAAVNGAAPKVEVRAIPPKAVADGHTGFRCEVGSGAALSMDEFVPRIDPPTASGSVRAKSTRKASYVARIAVETDYEYYQIFGNTTDATDYAGDLIAYASTIYSAELDTGMEVAYLDLWTTSTDPYTETGSLCSLYQFGRYWNTNHTGRSRTTAAYLSGKSTGGGVAWIGVLCNGSFSVNHQGNCPGLSPQIDTYGGAYAFIGSISGTFNINSPTSVWDIVATAHEIGHNFNSPHTHCYGDIGGNASPVDECYSGECGNSGCSCATATLPCGTAGAGCGTIMSYCHLLSGGMGNISLTLGDGHPYGTAPERVPTRMSDHVVSRASLYPACFDAGLPDAIFDDGFESGDMTNWSSSVQ